MGLLDNVIKKTDAVTAPSDDKKVLVSINSRIEDLKLQNLENAKFLRGLSKKIETELEQIRIAETNRSIEVKDNSEVVESLERLNNSLRELNNNDVMTEIDRVQKALDNINNDDVISEIDRVQKALDNINNDDVISEIDRVQKTLDSLNNNDVILELDRVQKKIDSLDIDRVMGVIESVNNMGNKLATIQTEFDRINQMVEDTSNKVNSIITLPGSVKKLLQMNNDTMANNFEDLVRNMGEDMRKRNSTMKIMIGVNLWLTFLNVAIFVAYIMGIFN